MTRQTPIGTCAKSMCAETERILHEFVRDTVSHLATSLKDSTPAREEDTRWERGSDGHFRERKKCVGIYWSMLTDDWLTTLPKYQSCVAQLKSDLVIG